MSTDVGSELRRSSLLAGNGAREFADTLPPRAPATESTIAPRSTRRLITPPFGPADRGSSELGAIVSSPKSGVKHPNEALVEHPNEALMDYLAVRLGHLVVVERLVEDALLHARLARDLAQGAA
jgi:hypothetical protein